MPKSIQQQNFGFFATIGRPNKPIWAKFGHVSVYHRSAIAHQIWPSSVNGGSAQEPPNVKICRKLCFLATESRYNEHIQMKFGAMGVPQMPKIVDAKSDKR